mmetsp:Transcript_15142/g.12880  ORF Transcript_15142/g.12880 Transcript_15142/m.12880 type:complete len:216 (-) Transcript_15142:224-871(-)
MSEETYDYLFKTVIIGDSGVGKSNIFCRFIRDEFNLDSKATIGVEFSAKNVTVQDKTIKAQVWDTAGQERFRALAKSYYRGAVGALLVYDITSYESFQHVERWLKEVKEHAEPHLVVLLVGNKCDLEDKRAVKQEEGAELAEKYSLGFMETSAKDNVNIESSFNRLITEIFNVLDRMADTTEKTTTGNQKTMGGGETIQISSKKNSGGQKKKGCC